MHNVPKRDFVQEKNKKGKETKLEKICSMHSWAILYIIHCYLSRIPSRGVECAWIRWDEVALEKLDRQALSDYISQDTYLHQSVFNVSLSEEEKSNLSFVSLFTSFLCT